MKKAVFYILVWTLAAAALGVIGVRGGFFNASTAQAIGDLTIDWGVSTTGDPIFNVIDMVPGQVESRDVKVTNNATVDREMGMRNLVKANTGMGDALDIVVKAEGIDVYGGTSGTGVKTLSEFYVDGAAADGLSLTTLGPSESKTLTFEVSFNGTAGNLFQKRTTVFDLTLGVTGEQAVIPAECAGIEFDGEPIIGTDGSDSLRGTPGNDLIFGMEGSDSLRGYGGDDCLVGGPGSDSLRGYDGADVLLGGEGSDSLRGNNGPDTLYGGEGTDSLKGGPGDDVLVGNGGNDSLKGGRGDDELTGDDGVDSARGGKGFDTCSAESTRQCEI